MFKIVLVEPRIAQNTGSIGRMCYNAGFELHIIKPCVFSLDEKAVRRAGLDYWAKLSPVIWDSLDEFLKFNLDFKERFFSLQQRLANFIMKLNFKGVIFYFLAVKVMD